MEQAGKSKVADPTEEAGTAAQGSDSMSDRQLAEAVLARAIRPKTADIRRLAEAVLAKAPKKKRKAKEAQAKSADKKEKAPKSQRKLAKIPGQKRKKR